MVKIYTVFRPKRLKNHTLWGGTYLYSLYRGVPPPPETDDRPITAVTRKTCLYIYKITAEFLETCRVGSHVIHNISILFSFSFQNTLKTTQTRGALYLQCILQQWKKSIAQFFSRLSVIVSGHSCTALKWTVN